MNSGTANEDGEFGFQIAPMVDVVFVLLLFFMACAGQTVTEGLLKVEVPGDTSGRIFDPPLVVDIDPAGTVSVNGQIQPGSSSVREIPGLVQFLKDAMAVDREIPVIIRPAPDARHERMIDVLNSCRQAKVKNLTFG